MLIPALALFAAQAAPAASAQSQDLRCIAVISVVMGTKPQVEQAAAIPLVTYYVGRVTARDPSIDLDRELGAIIVDEKAFLALVPSESQRCSAEMKTLGAEMKRVGAALQRRAGTGPK